MSPPDTSHDSSHDSPHGKTLQKLIYMANQIGTFFISQDKSSAPERTAEHIKKFWDPRMRDEIIAHLDRGGEGLGPAARPAIEQLRAARAPSG